MIQYFWTSTQIEDIHAFCKLYKFPEEVQEMFIYMYELENMLLQMQEHLEKVVTQVKADLNTTVPEGHLRISIDKNKPRYYQCIDDNKGVYIPRDNKELPKRLAQKGYNKAVVKKGEARLKQIKRITKNYSDDEIEKIYTSMNKARQLLVTPIEPTWDQLLTKWYEEEYQGKEFKEGTPLILTEKGERVRSKSEKILADYFYRKNILYKYEKPLHLKGYGTVYPDFTFLSRKTYREIYWEHEGMMDKQDYARAAVRKIESYQINHIYPGERLIITFETEQNILNSKIIENLIEKYLL